MLIHPVFHVSLLKPHHELSYVDEQSSQNNSAPRLTSPLSPPDPPHVTTNNMAPLYEVERVLGKRCRGNRIQYLVKWVGYEDHENSWEPEENLAEALDAIRKWEQTDQQKERQDRQARQPLSRGRM